LAPEDRLWLIGVARRCVADHRRSGLRRSLLYERLVRQAASSPSFRPDEAGSNNRIYEALNAVRPADREALILVLWDGLSHTEAASVLGCSVNAFELRYRRARAKVGAFLEGADAISLARSDPTPQSTPEPRRTTP
jgi:RNA polymerase sigma-70 factor (ECF subfamily)